MIESVKNINIKSGFLVLQNLKIGTNNKISDFNHYKLNNLNKLLTGKNIIWNKIEASKEEVLSKINKLYIL